MKSNIYFRITALLLCLTFIILSCSDKKTNIEKPDTNPPIEIPKGEVQVAVYYYPNWGPGNYSEWKTMKEAKPQFKGHQQPKVPLWGYTDESDPMVMSEKIDAAADNGIDVFIFDWYYYDKGSGGTTDSTYHWHGSKYHYQALENGFLKATNNSKLKFALMWCNHDLGTGVRGAVKPETFDHLMDYVIEKYFKHPSYWKIDGCPYFSIYEFETFLKTYDNDYTKATAAIEKFRSKVKTAGFPDLHLNGILRGLRGGIVNITVENLKINSITSYVWTHHIQLPDFPATKYTKVAEDYFRNLKYGGGFNGLENAVQRLPVPYHIHVSMGWDSSPRCKNAPDWMERRDYPFGPVIIENTPYLFKKYLAKAKEMTMEKPENERIITINSWNEWVEGNYLEPDTIHKMAYLEAVKEVFKTN